MDSRWCQKGRQRPLRVEVVQIREATNQNRMKKNWKRGFIGKKFSCDIIPTSILHVLALSSTSIFVSLLPLVSPDSLLCLLSAQVSNTTSEQWPIVLYWAALVSLPLLSFPPFICRALFSIFCSLFSYSLSSHFWEDWWLKWKKWRKEATKSEDEWQMQGFVWNS